MTDKILVDQGFKSCYSDIALFDKDTPIYIIVLLLYVDDMIIIGNGKEGICDIGSLRKKIICSIRSLKTQIHITLVCYLTSKLAYSRKRYLLSQLKLLIILSTNIELQLTR